MDTITDLDRLKYRLAPLHSGKADKAALLSGYAALARYGNRIIVLSREASRNGRTVGDLTRAEDLAAHAQLASDHATALAKALAENRAAQGK